MSKLWALVVARNKEFYRDKGTLAWTFLFPLLVIIGFTFGYSGGSQALFKVGVVGLGQASGSAAGANSAGGAVAGANANSAGGAAGANANSANAAAAGANSATGAALAAFLKTPAMEFVDESDGDLSVHIRKVERHQLDLLVDPSTRRYWVNSDSPKGAAAERLLLASLGGGISGAAGAPAEGASAGAAASARPVSPSAATSSIGAYTRAPVEGAEIRYVDWLVPGILAMNMMFNALFGVGYTIVRYRKNGVLKRLRATPLTAFHFLAAQLVSRLFILLGTSSLVLGGAWMIVRFPFRGSILDLVVFFSVGAMSLISLGLVVAARISTEELAEGVLNLMTWPMMFLSGVWFSLEGARPIILKFAQVLPLTHIVDGIRAILLDGASLAQVAPQMAVLAVIAAVGLAVGSFVFRWN
jgi:ABC-2 type transport system permease protein